MKTLGVQIRTARLQRKMSQSELARQVGCKQSALSMFEGGRMTALNDQTIGKICHFLGILPPSTGEQQAMMAVQPVVEKVRAYCPNPECPSNLPYSVNGQELFLPRRLEVSAAEHHCRWCGEIVERACPECGAAVQSGAFCTQCGHTYVTCVEPVRKETFQQRLQLVQWGE